MLPQAPGVLSESRATFTAWRIARAAALIGDGVALPARIWPGKAFAGSRVDHCRSCTAGHAELPDALDVVTAGLQFVVDRVRHSGLDRHLVDANPVRPERYTKMLSLRVWALERRMQVRIPAPRSNPPPSSGFAKCGRQCAVHRHPAQLLYGQ